MTKVYVPESATSDAPRSVCDNWIDALQRDRHVDRLQKLAEDWEEEAAQVALEGNPRKAHYIEQHWLEWTQERVQEIAKQPIKRLFPWM